MESTNFNQEQASKRPQMLTVLCILTFVSTGFGVLGVLISALAGKQDSSTIKASNEIFVKLANDMRQQGSAWAAENMERLGEMAIYQNENHWLSLGLNAVALSAGVLGALYMWQGRKMGFHLYIIYSFFSVFGIYLIVPMDAIPTFSIVSNGIFAIIFILLYARNLKWLE
jgi:hypothetical protein